MNTEEEIEQPFLDYRKDLIRWVLAFAGFAFS
jgi:hypothetical protein